MIRLIRVFVSSPSDVAEERSVLDEVIDRINRTDGDRMKMRLELFKWETGVAPQIGPGPQTVVDSQMPTRYDIYLGIMKRRFGTPTGTYGSGTEKEFHDALERWGKVGQPWILFYFGKEKVDLDEVDLEQYAKVKAFRQSIQEKGLYATYEGVRGAKEAFFDQVELHLRQVLDLLPPTGLDMPPKSSQSPADSKAYLRNLLEKTSQIDIHGLQVGQGKAHRFPIEDLFISLTTTRAAACSSERVKEKGREQSRKSTGVDAVLRESQPLHAALCNERLVVVGDPGAGKTTFVRRVAHVLSLTELGDVPDAAQSRLGMTDPTFPILVKLNELADYIKRNHASQSAPTNDDSPAWLIHYLSAGAKDNNWDLGEGFFRQQLQDGRCTILLDGLDEAPDRLIRERLSRLIENVASIYKGNRLVVTSRPIGFSGEEYLPGFAHASIEPLSDQAVETFLSRWCQAVYSESSKAAGDYCSELLQALRGRPDIRRLARNPVMLTALAVVHWNERRLPEQRADLYESIIRWLSRSREQRPGRESAEKTVTLLQQLALAMQNHPDGMQTTTPKRSAAESIEKHWRSGRQRSEDSIARAEAFIEAEELDSGIIVGRGNGVQFWHRTFQEYLGARAIAALPEAGQRKLLWGTPVKIYLPEWREVMLLFAGILHQHGSEKVDHLIRTMLGKVEKDAALADQARCVGLIGSMLRDLEPVGYEPPDHGYNDLLHQVMGIFDRERSQTVPIETRIEAADALGQAGDPRLDMSQDDYWVAIDGGEFWMGAQSDDPAGAHFDTEASERESPVHRVHLDPFRLARYPVTVGQYQKFVEDEGYGQEQWWQAGGFGELTEPRDWNDQVQYPSRPVVGVSWFEAAAFSQWAGLRLPTEAEWERAAQGKDGRRFPWGGEGADPLRLNYERSGIGHPTPVGIYPLGVTPNGIYDLAGNVWEWCTDWYRPYSEAALINPSGPKKASYRVVRGGGWSSPSRGCRAAYRRRSEPQDRLIVIGFRVALVPPGQEASSGRQERAEPGAEAEGAKRRSPTPRAGVEGVVSSR